MATVNHPITGSAIPSLPGRLARGLPALGALVLLAVGLAAVTYKYPPPDLGWLLAGGIGLVGLVALALSRYDVAVGLGFVLLALVNVEPAPPDVVFAIVMAVAAATGRFDLARVPFAILAALGAFITFNLLSVIEAIEPGLAGLFLSITLYLAVFSVWLTGFVNSFWRARIVVLTYLAAAVFSAAIGSLAYFYPFPGSESVLFGAGEATGQRVKGLFEDANVFAPFLIPIGLVLLEEMLHPRLIRLKPPLKVACLIILLLGVTLAFSRAAYVNLVIGVLVLLAVLMLRRGGGARAGALLTVILVSGGLVAATLTVTGQTEFLAERAKRQSYDTKRFSAQRTGIELAEQHPLGIGPGQFEVVSPVSAHSTYIRTLAEGGLFGFISFFSLMAITLLLAIRNAARGWHTYGIGSAALLAAWCGILANSFVIDSMHWRHLWVVAALIWAGAVGGAARERS